MRLAHIFPSRPAFLGLSCLVGALLLAACSSSPPPAYYALDLQKPPMQEPKSFPATEPVIIVLPADVPEMVDRFLACVEKAIAETYAMRLYRLGVRPRPALGCASV